MITTLKIKYSCDNQSGLQQYIRQYNSCLHVAVNLLLNETVVKSSSYYKKQNSIIQQKFSQMNNIELMNYWMLLGRRSYEFYNQYIIKTKEIKKNIVFPDLQMYNSFLTKSLEEFDLKTTFVNLLNQYNLFKKSKTMYRLSIDKFNLQFSRLFSLKSNVNIYYF